MNIYIDHVSDSVTEYLFFYDDIEIIRISFIVKIYSNFIYDMIFYFYDSYWKYQKYFKIDTNQISTSSDIYYTIFFLASHHIFYFHVID